MIEPRRIMDEATFLAEDARGAFGEERWELVDGYPILKLGDWSAAYCRIQSNFNSILDEQLPDNECKPGWTLGVLAGVGRLTVYRPDFGVDCGKSLKRQQETFSYTKPTLVGEILTPWISCTSSRIQAFGRRIDDYRAISTINHILVVSQAEIEVEHWTRAPDDQWAEEPAIFRSLEDVIVIEKPGISFALSGLYNRVEFEGV